MAADGESVTFTAVFPATQEEKTQDTKEDDSTQAAQTQSQTTGGKAAAVSGGSVSLGSSAGVSVSSASAGTAAAATEETNLNSYTETTTIFGISTDEKMSISVSVDEQDIGQLSEGISAQITLDAIDNETFTGTVTSIHTISNTAAGGVTKYTAEVTFDKTEDMLQGMNASVVMTVSSSENCLMIPEAALQEDGKTTTVYTTYDESTGEYGGETEVTTGVSDGTSVEILSGLSEGDTVYYSYTEDSGSSFGGFDMGGGAMMGGGGDMPSGGNGGGDMPGGNGGGGGKDMPSGGPQ